MPKLWIMLLFFPLYTAHQAEAACPKNKKEWQKLGPKLLVETAVKKITQVEISDFSAKLGGKAAQGAAFPFKEQKKDFVLVEAKLPQESLSLSGVMKCDLESKQPVLLSLAWVKGDKSGLVKLSK